MQLLLIPVNRDKTDWASVIHTNVCAGLRGGNIADDVIISNVLNAWDCLNQFYFICDSSILIDDHMLAHHMYLISHTTDTDGYESTKESFFNIMAVAFGVIICGLNGACVVALFHCT